MKITTILLALLTAAAGAQTITQPQPANTVSIGVAATPTTPSTLCQEPTCVITGSSAPVNLYLGVGSTWCTVAVVTPSFPLTISWPNNSALCATDPRPNVVKQIVVVQQAKAVTINYTLNGVAQTPYIVPALPPPPVTVISTYNCTPAGTIPIVTITNYSDGHFTLTGSGSCTQK